MRATLRVIFSSLHRTQIEREFFRTPLSITNADPSPLPLITRCDALSQSREVSPLIYSGPTIYIAIHPFGRESNPNVPD